MRRAGTSGRAGTSRRAPTGASDSDEVEVEESFEIEDNPEAEVTQVDQTLNIDQDADPEAYDIDHISELVEGYQVECSIDDDGEKIHIVGGEQDVEDAMQIIMEELNNDTEELVE
eukprot:272472_1